MPSIHISETVFEKYVEREGGYSSAKNAVKKQVAEGVEDDE